MTNNARSTSSRLILLLALSAAPGFGQAESGTVVGAVSDQAGAAVAGATVTVLNTGTGFARPLITNEQGQYTANNFPPGQITITVEKTGFKKLIRSGIQLTAADAITVNLQLQVGDVQPPVEVGDRISSRREVGGGTRLLAVIEQFHPSRAEYYLDAAEGLWANGQRAKAIEH